jgi:hypothetical protein
MTELNTKLIRDIVETIEKSPGMWDQEVWARKGSDTCDTRFCFAGWTLELSGFLDAKGRPNVDAIQHAAQAGYDIDLETIADDTDNFPWGEVAADLLGIEENTAELFSGHVRDGTWDGFKRELKAVTGLSFPSYGLGIETRGLGIESWNVDCSDCGRIFDSVDASAQGHDDAIRFAAEHDKLIHGGSGTVDTAKLINPPVSA